MEVALDKNAEVEPQPAPPPAPDTGPGKRKIAIFGTTPHRGEGPYADDSGWERWTIGPGGMDAHGWERLYEVHGTWPEDFHEYLNKLSLYEPPKQIVMCFDPHERMQLWRLKHGKSEEEAAKLVTGAWPAARVLPRDALFEKYGGRLWFSSSISYCIADAIELFIKGEIEEVGLWGIDLESGEEYRSQFVGCRHLLDLARFVGLNVTLPAGCGLQRDPTPYPDRYETKLALALDRKKDFVRRQQAEFSAQFEQLRIEVARAEGAILSLRSIGAPPEKIQEAEQHLNQLGAQYSQTGAQINGLQGSADTLEFFQRMYVWGFDEPGELSV